MKQPYRHRVNQREFLNLPGFHEGAYVMAYVEDTSERGPERCEHTGTAYNPHPRMLLQIADCDSHISLDFDISSPHRRMNSFHKIQTLIDALEAFKAGMAEESALYKRRDRELSEVDGASTAPAPFRRTRGTSERDAGEEDRAGGNGQKASPNAKSSSS